MYLCHSYGYIHIDKAKSGNARAPKATPSRRVYYNFPDHAQTLLSRHSSPELVDMVINSLQAV